MDNAWIMDAAATAHSGVRQTSGSRWRACYHDDEDDVDGDDDYLDGDDDEDGYERKMFMNRIDHRDCSMRDAKKCEGQNNWSPHVDLGSPWQPLAAARQQIRESSPFHARCLSLAQVH